MEMKQMTREEWLDNATNNFREHLFKDVGAIIPHVKCSVGFPGGRGMKRHVIGQIWHGESVKDGVSQIFIHPSLDNSFEVIAVLIHELVHACTPGTGHKHPFIELARKVGLEGRPKATYAGQALMEKLQPLVEHLGKYPHTGLNVGSKDKVGSPLIKIKCDDCGYNARVTSKWLDSTGPLICPCNHLPMAIKSVAGTQRPNQGMES